MSYSSLYGIKKNYVGEELYEYRNSWLFSPVVWDVLPDKYIPLDIKTPYGYKKRIIGDSSGEIWRKINNIMNNSDNTSDRVCWEMTNQQIFFTKDKECIANNILKFIEQNKGYDKHEEDNISPLKREHIIERFNEIANDILSLDENEYPYFVFKNTSVDDGVEHWFYNYDENDEYVDKSLKDWNEFVAEFVVIEDDRIANFISNLDYKYE
jgi:hypothetical protein